jgi:phage baseplate assembly protein V
MLGVNRSDQTTSGVGSAEATDHSRRLNNLARYGVVAEVDYTGETAGFPAVRVDMQDGALRSDWVPWFTPRAGADVVWDPPTVGEVVMLLAPSGELANGVAIPGMFSDGNANGDRAALHRRTYSDGTVVEHDSDNHTLTIDTTASTGSVVIRTGSASIEASGAVTVEAQGQVSITGSAIHLNP